MDAVFDALADLGNDPDLTAALDYDEDMADNDVEQSPDVTFGRPRVKGRGTPVMELANLWTAGDSIAAIAGDFGLTEAQVEKALRLVMLHPDCDDPGRTPEPPSEQREEPDEWCGVYQAKGHLYRDVDGPEWACECGATIVVPEPATYCVQCGSLSDYCASPIHGPTPCCDECTHASRSTEAPSPSHVDEPIEESDELSRVAEAIEELMSAGRFNCADAVLAMVARSEAQKASSWTDCDCGARKPYRCPVCDAGAIMPCVCREWPSTKLTKLLTERSKR